jgi:hypothetical protein
MPGPVPGIHVFSRSGAIGVDGRVKPGHDVPLFGIVSAQPFSLAIATPSRAS